MYIYLSTVPYSKLSSNMVNLLMLEDGTLWTGTSGISHAGQPITKEMLFGIGSITKTFTTTTILSMYEEGLLELDDPISDYLPDFNNINSDITIRQLMKPFPMAFYPSKILPLNATNFAD